LERGRLLVVEPDMTGRTVPCRPWPEFVESLEAFVMDTRRDNAE
jgi:hypothetical protein